MTQTLSPRRGLMLLISSPSGAGKTSLSRRLVADHADLELSVSATTRAPRPGEEDGREYHFVDRPTFDAMVEAPSSNGPMSTSTATAVPRRRS